MLFTLLAAAASAHQPVVVTPGEAGAYTPFAVEDPDVSIVVYGERTCDDAQLWLETDAEPGYDLFVQLGLPVGDAIEDWRPRLAVIAPGLPAADLGFDIPDGMGAVMWEAAAEPTQFDEPYSGTSSWILVEETITLPEGGPASIVAWDPSGKAGRMWIAVGTLEQFESEDWERIMDLLPAVRAFHGLDGSDVRAPTECAAADEQDDGDAQTAGPAGCSSTGLGTSGGAALLALWFAARRRRRA